MLLFASSTSSAALLGRLDRAVGAHALVVVVHGDRERPLGSVLADDVLLEEAEDLARLGQIEVR
jgi:hypothetical protein